jgi:hypothetical protein
VNEQQEEWQVRRRSDGKLLTWDGWGGFHWDNSGGIFPSKGSAEKWPGFKPDEHEAVRSGDVL